MNKKGEIFIPIMLIVFITLLLLFAMLIRDNNKKLEQIKIAEVPLRVLNTYEKDIQIKTYLTELSKQISNTNLESNGGYLKPCSFYKDFSSGLTYTQWQTCPELNTKKDFEDNFKTKINEYTESSNLFMQNLLNRELDNKEKLIVKDIKIEKEITVIYEPIILNNSITNLSIEYTFTPEIKTKMPDLSIYSKFHDLISINCINKPQTNCKSLLEENFKGILIKFQGNNLLISYNKINLAIDTTKHLQPKFNQFT